MIFFIIVFSVYTVDKLSNDGFEPSYSYFATKMELDTLTFLPSIFNAWTFQYNWVNFRKQLVPMTERNAAKTMGLACVIVCVIYLITILVAFLSFERNVLPAVIENFYGLGDDK